MTIIQLSNCRAWTAVVAARINPCVETRTELQDALNQRRSMREIYHAPIPHTVATEVAGLREDIRELIAGIRESKLAPAVCAEIRDSIRRHWQEMTAARERIHALKRNFWLAVE